MLVPKEYFFLGNNAKFDFSTVGRDLNTHCFSVPNKLPFLGSMAAVAVQMAINTCVVFFFNKKMEADEAFESAGCNHVPQ